MSKKEKLINSLNKFFSNHIVDCFVYLFAAFVILYIQTDAFYFTLGGIFRVLQYGILAIFAVILFVRYYAIHREISSFNIVKVRVLIFGIIFVLLSFLINISNLGNAHRHLMIGAHIVLLPLIVFSFDLKRLFKYFVVLFTIALSISLVAFLIDSKCPHLFDFLPQIVSAAGTRFRTYGFGVLYVHGYSDTTGFRNTSLFREPGIHGLFVVLTLILMFKREYRFKKNIWNFICVFMLFLSGISSLSTTALICLTLLVFLFLLKNAKFNQVKTYVILTIFVGILGFFIYSIAAHPSYVDDNEIFRALFSKFFNKASNSFYNRLEDQFGCFMCMFRNPLFGNGWGNLETITYAFALTSGHYSSGGINSFLIIASVYGVFFGFFIAKYWYLFCSKMFNQHKFQSIFCFIIVVVIFGANDFTNNLIFLLIPYATYFYSDKILLVDSTVKKGGNNEKEKI